MTAKLTPAAQFAFNQWVELDDLWKAGKGEGQEADDLRDQMDRPWYALTESEREEVEAAIRERLGPNGS